MNATTTALVATLAEAGSTVIEHAPYLRTYEVSAIKGAAGVVLTISRTGGNIVAASAWVAGEEARAIRGTTTKVVRAFARCPNRECWAEITGTPP
jgi:hypothetical protein